MSELYHHGILGMRWGVRRYQNADGTLTEAGKKRHAMAVQRNMQRKPKDRVDNDDLIDPNKWAEDDLKNTQSALNEMKNITNNLKDIEQVTRNTKQKEMDLSGMSDADLRAAINRKLMENQYNSLMNPVQISKGRERLHEVLDVGGKVLMIGTSAIGIALAIKQLKTG